MAATITHRKTLTEELEDIMKEAPDLFEALDKDDRSLIK